MIGTSISLKTTQVLTYPSISVCSWDDPAIFVEGELFESLDSYRTFKKTNVSTPYASGPIPDLATMLYYVLTKDANGTSHLWYPAGLGLPQERKHLKTIMAQNPIVTLLESTR